MSVQTQLRRSVFSLVILVALGGFAALEGEAAVDAGQLGATIASCPSIERSSEPVVSAGSSSSRADWRALLPAMIAR
jgi:hypothetical protein